MEQVTIGLIGLGSVGTGVARLLTEQADRLARRAGKRLRWKWAAVRDPGKSRGVQLDGVQVTTDVRRLLDDLEVDIVVELMGGIDPACSIVLDSLKSGKHVVTANKALLAERGPEIFAQARASGRAVAFEASVAGGIPIIQALGVSLAANQILNLAAILNGTCNYILTKMALAGDLPTSTRATLIGCVASTGVAAVSSSLSNSAPGPRGRCSSTGWSG